MISTNHVKLRSAQRGLCSHQIQILSAIGMDVIQKGGTSIRIISTSEKDRWVIALKEVLDLLRNTNQVGSGRIKRKIKAIKRLIEKLSVKHLPYLVVDDESNILITCGHYSNRKLKIN